jgi:protein ImuA
MLPAHASLPTTLAHLRTIAYPVIEHRIMPFGLSELDGRLGGGGLRGGALHEATAQSCSLADDAATTLFLAGVAGREALRVGGPVLWASCRNDLYAPGLAQAGLSSANVIHAQPRDDEAVLAVVEDAVRDGTPSAVVAEIGRMSMVATRRLQLVAADADIPVLVLRRRRNLEQDPLAEPSAAWTRWRIGSAPSERLDVAGVGRPRWSIELARQRGGEPFSVILEGCDETGCLAVPAALGHRAAETAGPLRFAAA